MKKLINIIVVTFLIIFISGCQTIAPGSNAVYMTIYEGTVIKNNNNRLKLSCEKITIIDVSNLKTEELMSIKDLKKMCEVIDLPSSLRVAPRKVKFLSPSKTMTFKGDFEYKVNEPAKLYYLE